MYYISDDPDGRWVGLGRPLHKEEMNYNWWTLDARLTVVEGALPTLVSVANIDQPAPTSVRFTMSNAATYTLTLPTSTFTDRGEWLAETQYFVNDTFTENGALYRVTFEHVSADSFSPTANDGAGHDYYATMLSLPANSLPSGGAEGQVVEKASGTNFDYRLGYKLPTGGTARQFLIKQSSTNQDAEFDTPLASDIDFAPSTGSTLTSTDVGSALEELDAKIASGDGVDAAHVDFAPSTGSWLTTTDVAAALEELSAISAVHVGFTPPTGSALTATNVADALAQLEALTGGGGGASTLHGLSDVDVTEGAGINGYVLYWNNGATKWQAKALATVATSGAYSDLSGTPSLGTIASHATTDFLAITGGTLSGALTLNADPASALQAATKQYVDNLLQGLTPKAAVLCATTANITLSGEQTIDGVTTSTSRVLVKDQSTASQNGLYVSASGSWTRATDMDAWSEVPSAYVFVEEGSTNADTGWVCTSDPGGSIGSTSVAFVKFTGGSATALSALSDVNISEGPGINGYVLYWNDSAGKWQAKSVATSSGSSLQKGDGSGGFSAATAGADYGRASIDQNSQSTAYTTVLSDAGKHIYHPSSDNNARTVTIDSNANVAYPVGTAITFINEINTVTIAITSDTLVLAGAGTTGSRTLAANGMATAIKVGTTRWYISGSGLT